MKWCETVEMGNSEEKRAKGRECECEVEVVRVVVMVDRVDGIN